MYSTVQYITVQYSAVQYSTVQYSTASDSCQVSMKFEFMYEISKNKVSDFMKIRPAAAELLYEDRQTDGQTDGQT